MKKVFKRIVSTVLSTALLVSSISFSAVDAAAATTIKAGGWYETIFAELDVAESSVTAVSYSSTDGGSSGSLTDTTYDMAFTNLVRSNGSGKTRIDIPGLKAGTYSITVTAGGQNYTASNIKVYGYDRSGYAHKDAGSVGVGAYNNDGTPKSNAVVLYVTEENKNTVTVPGLSNSPVGIGNILNEKSTDTGSTGSGKAAALKELNGSKPLIIRFIGTVEAGDSNTKANPPAQNILGLTQYDATGNGGTGGDNGMVARMYKGKNITIEGIGTDANIDGWGFQVISQTGYPTEYIEFRNLTFTNTPEDAIGLEGTASESTNPQTKEWITSPIRYCWVHNCTFEMGYCKNPAESDKAEGDGSLDFKRGYGFTASYNHYVKNHKTNLIGSSSKSIQYDVTYHHNYYEEVMSRQPLSRQANVHIYNSYFKNGDSTSYIYSPRANSYIFSEKNYFENCKNPVDSAKEGSAYVKSYKDNFSGCTGTNAAIIVDDPKYAVSGSNNPYKSDFEGSFPYSYEATDPVQAKADCIAKAGVMKPADEIDMDPVKQASISEFPAKAISLPYTLDLTQTYSAGRQVVDNAILNAASKSSGGSVKIKKEGIIFTVNQAAVVSFTSGASSKYGMQLTDAYGVALGSIATSGAKSITVDPGTYVLESGNIEKDAFLESFKVTAKNATDPTVEVTTQTVVESTTQATTQSQGQTEKPSETTTQAQNSEITGDGYIWNYTTGENTENFFDVSANDWSSAVPVTYKGATLTKAIKMESTTRIAFDADTDGKLYVYTYSTDSSPTLEINDTAESVSANGVTEFSIGSGMVEISRGTKNTYIYFMQFVPAASAVQTTESTTESTTEKTTESSTESTTIQVDENGDINIEVATVNAAVNTLATIPVKVTSTNDKNVGGYLVGVSLADGLEYSYITDNTNGQMVEYDSGNAVLVAYVGEAPSNGNLFTINVKANKTGTFPVTLISQEIIDTDAATLSVKSIQNGSLTTTVKAGGNGDVYSDNVRDEKDAAYLMKYLSGVDMSKYSKWDLSQANCDENSDAVPDMRDVVWILSNKKDPITDNGGSTGQLNYTYPETALAAGTYSTLPKGSFYLAGSAAYGDSDKRIEVPTGDGNYASFKLDKKMKLEFSVGNKAMTILDDNGKTITTLSGSASVILDKGNYHIICEVSGSYTRLKAPLTVTEA